MAYECSTTVMGGRVLEADGRPRHVSYVGAIVRLSTGGVGCGGSIVFRKEDRIL